MKIPFRRLGRFAVLAMKNLLLVITAPLWVPVGLVMIVVFWIIEAILDAWETTK